MAASPMRSLPSLYSRNSAPKARHPCFSWTRITEEITGSIMPSFNLPPEERATVRPFDPLVLDRTVIAIPLLKQMEEELALVKVVERDDSTALSSFNAAIKLNEEYPSGLDVARDRALALASEAKEEAVRASAERLTKLPE